MIATRNPVSAEPENQAVPPCHWGGGNDIIWCSTCGAEYAYAKGEERPACPRAAEAAAPAADRNPVPAAPETYRDMLIALADEIDCFAAHAEPGEEVSLAFTPQELKAISSSLRADVARVPATPAGETFATIAAWAEATFGSITPERTVARADEEMVELRAEPGSVEEAADVVICLARYAGLWAAVERKMVINRKRQWRRVGDGTGYHIKAPAPSAEA